jgi:hypothetical protein
MAGLFKKLLLKWTVLYLTGLNKVDIPLVFSKV